MSVSLLISGKDIPEEKWENIPIASEESFKKLWLPLSKDLDLEYVPLFEIGLDIDAENLNDVIKEMKLLEEALKKAAKTNESYTIPLERARNIINILPNLLQKYSHAFIG